MLLPHEQERVAVTGKSVPFTEDGFNLHLLARLPAVSAIQEHPLEQ